MKLNNSLFSIAPEALLAVNIYFPGKFFAIVNFEILVATEHDGIIALEPIGIDDRPFSYSPDVKFEDCFSTHITKDLNLNISLFFEDTEYLSGPMSKNILGADKSDGIPKQITRSG